MSNFTKHLICLIRQLIEGELCMSGINAGCKTGRRNVKACRDNFFLALQESRLIGNIEDKRCHYIVEGRHILKYYIRFFLSRIYVCPPFFPEHSVFAQRFNQIVTTQIQLPSAFANYRQGIIYANKAVPNYCNPLYHAQPFLFSLFVLHCTHYAAVMIIFE